MHESKIIANRLIRVHKTNDPYRLASNMNILVLFEELGNVLGYFSTYKRIPIIHINCDADEQEQKFTCAHELGHRMLHPKVNTPFLKKHTFLSIDRIEREANEFAVQLLLNGSAPEEGETLEQFCGRNGVPREMTRYF